jgi:hypothetical protein
MADMNTRSRRTDSFHEFGSEGDGNDPESTELTDLNSKLSDLYDKFQNEFQSVGRVGADLEGKKSSDVSPRIDDLLVKSSLCLKFFQAAADLSDDFDKDFCRLATAPSRRRSSGEVEGKPSSSGLASAGRRNSCPEVRSLSKEKRKPTVSLFLYDAIDVEHCRLESSSTRSTPASPCVSKLEPRGLSTSSTTCVTSPVCSDGDGDDVRDNKSSFSDGDGFSDVEPVQHRAPQVEVSRVSSSSSLKARFQPVPIDTAVASSFSNVSRMKSESGFASSKRFQQVSFQRAPSSSPTVSPISPNSRWLRTEEPPRPKSPGAKWSHRRLMSA